MIAIFDADGGGDVDFEEFVSGLSAFSNKGDKEQKLRFAFKVYDIDRDGFISNGELFIVLKMMVGSNLKDQQLQQIVDKTIMEADLDKDGKISFEEFTRMVENTDVSMSMTLGKCCVAIFLCILYFVRLCRVLLTALQISSELLKRESYIWRAKSIVSHEMSLQYHDNEPSYSKLPHFIGTFASHQISDRHCCPQG